jgi:adenylate cyclase
VLPERVRQAISDQQDRSEILIGWFQLAVVVTFGTLYLISPKTFSAESPFAPVPWALSFYLGLTVVLWSFHLQYDQPASFYLKAPTLLYVFIFIALRALRFEARYVVLAGVVAALGWGLMILYVVTNDPGDMMITRDYVQYMTSNSILLGAEFDKIISILVVTAIIAVALQRAKGLLVRSVAEQTAAQELSRCATPRSSIWTCVASPCWPPGRRRMR